jgi:hypothetical protein
VPALFGQALERGSDFYSVFAAGNALKVEGIVTAADHARGAGRLGTRACRRLARRLLARFGDDSTPIVKGNAARQACGAAKDAGLPRCILGAVGVVTAKRGAAGDRS